tara:strand:+ start:2084 stop:2320 length:237 start_codon:yes stop_codon:yes gene_type:complete
MAKYHRKRTPAKDAPRNENLSIRVSAQDRARIESAAELLNTSVSAYFVDSALAIADMIELSEKNPKMVRVGRFLLKEA